MIHESFNQNKEGLKVLRKQKVGSGLADDVKLTGGFAFANRFHEVSQYLLKLVFPIRYYRINHPTPLVILGIPPYPRHLLVSTHPVGGAGTLMAPYPNWTMDRASTPGCISAA